MKKSIFILIPLCLLLLSSCYVDEFGPPNLYYLCFADSTGTLQRTELPFTISSYEPHPFYDMERLKDGRALIISNKLHLWNPYTDSMTDITPSGFVSAAGRANVAISSDGAHIYYSTGAKIIRRNLNSNVEETLVDSLEASFFAPVLSQDEHYLTFIKSTKNTNNTLLYEGYPLYLNLISGEVTSLPQTGILVTHAFVDSFRERIYYTVSGHLYTMELDGSHRALVFSNFGNAMLSGDGNFLVNSLYDYYESNVYTQLYRDNRNLGWKFFEAYGQNALARNINLLYYGKLKRLYAMNLDTAEVRPVLPSVVFAHEVLNFMGIAPAWDGKDLVCVVVLRGKE